MRYRIELEVWPDSEDDDPYMDLVDALDDYLPYNHVYTILSEDEITGGNDAGTSGN